ncbi:twin-arginine translocation signal domain-containing protein [Pseudoduganella chitinolytica]|uniref:Twin-arginine translocation signal domain-containing protein n=1 Tax=Pseudoduganella chitinolytica TaxID=34070 RepID=A0ABY8BHG2_9BURK|nr:twin-arginine translocation signal domain-containing protein [Pseudoduganella chitinolytica]WEF35330.1 twin-arginine translocation signal domain-containing protein [Pseudoduganella chitinolytica]
MNDIVSVPPAAASEEPLRTRRAFLKAAPLGALALVAGPAPAVEVVPAAPAPAQPEQRGYHETEHIRRYYQTAAYW